MREPVDTNVLLRYLVEDPESPPPSCAGVFAFFQRLESGEQTALLPPLILFQAYFVLISYYEVPIPEAAGKLKDILELRGLEVPERRVLRSCFEILGDRGGDLVDAYLAALCRSRGRTAVYSYDEGLRALGLELLPIGDAAAWQSES